MCGIRCKKKKTTVHILEKYKNGLRRAAILKHNYITYKWSLEITCFTNNITPLHRTVLFCRSCPTNRVGSHPLYFPARMKTSASGTRRAADRVRAAASSAVVSGNTPGVFPNGGGQRAAELMNDAFA